MRRVFFLLAVVILAGGLTQAAATGAPTVARGEAVSARLLLVDAEPAMLRGIGFKPAEHVRIVVVAGTRDLTRRATASTAGGFTMRLSGVDVNNCTGFAATAIGDKGSRAVFKRAPGECPLP